MTLTVKWTRAVFIDRKNHAAAVETMAKVAETLKKDKLGIFLFPEGTRSHTSSLLPFKKGAFHVAIAGQMPVVPIVIGHYKNVYDSRKWLFNGGKIRIKGI